MTIKIRIAILAMSVLLSITAIAGESVQQKDANDFFQILKISAQDSRAVIKTSEGHTIVIKPGTDLGATGKVVEIAADRVVLEQKSGIESETVIIRLKDGKQSIERLKKIEPKRPVLYAPAAREMTK